MINIIEVTEYLVIKYRLNKYLDNNHFGVPTRKESLVGTLKRWRKMKDLDILNISLLTCEEFNPDTGIITNFFNGLQYNNARKRSFDIVTFMNGINVSSLEFTLHYYIIYLEEGTFTKVEEIELDLTEQKNELSDEEIDTFCLTYVSEIDGISFPAPGRYQIQVFIEKGKDDSAFFLPGVLPPVENLTCIYDLEVRKD